MHGSRCELHPTPGKFEIIEFTWQIYHSIPQHPPLGVIFRFAQEVTRIIDFANFNTVSSIL